MTNYGPISRKDFYRHRKMQDQFNMCALIVIGLGLAWFF